jgi:two-component system, OmpR family, sensor histidine kinase SenX3
VTVLVVVGLAGWSLLVFVALKLGSARRELRDARRAAAADEHASLTDAISDDRRDAEDRVAHAETVQHWLHAALDESTDAIVVVDRSGREIVRNAIARRFVGARTGELLAADALHELLQDALAGRSSEREIQLYGPPPQILQLRVFALRRDGEVVGAVGYMRDISEARRVESVRRDFVANVTHELKTPVGALGLLAETIGTTDDPNVVRQLSERVVREAERLSRIVDDLLDLSTIEAQEAPRRQPLPVRRLVNEAFDLVHAAADAAEVPLRVTPEPPEVQIVCDARQMRSAIVNLLDNAIKYSGPGQPVEIGASLRGDRVALIVRDYGIGIPTRDLERIFERFYRIDRARSRGTGGTGLGLAIVRHIVQAHGGEVDVESCEGEGSQFTLLLPLAARNGHRSATEPRGRAPDG